MPRKHGFRNLGGLAETIEPEMIWVEVINSYAKSWIRYLLIKSPGSIQKYLELPASSMSLSMPPPYFRKNKQHSVFPSKGLPTIGAQLSYSYLKQYHKKLQGPAKLLPQEWAKHRADTIVIKNNFHMDLWPQSKCT